MNLSYYPKYSLKAAWRSLLPIIVFSLMIAWCGYAIAGPVTVTVTKIKCIDDCRNASLEAAAESAADFYAKVDINGTVVVTPRADEDSVEVKPFWAISQVVPNSQPSVGVSIQVWDHDSTSGDDLADISPNAGSNLNITVNTATGKWSGDINWPASCATGDDDSDDDVAVQICIDVSVDSASGDMDGDGLLDGWERNGLNADGEGTIDVDLPKMNAKVDHRDLFLELDSEAGQAPSRAGIQSMKNAFAAAPLANPDGTTGVRLVVDTGLVSDPTANEAGPAPNCADGLDNDGDGQIDGADPECSGGGGSRLLYLDTAREGAVSNCGDGIDNDGDGAVDAGDIQCLVGDNFQGGSVVPTVGACNLDSAFYATKASNFFSLRSDVFRYAISAFQPATCANQNGGQGEIGGNDFIEFNHDGGTVTHEFGHNLNLQHARLCTSEPTGGKFTQ